MGEGFKKIGRAFVAIAVAVLLAPASIPANAGSAALVVTPSLRSPVVGQTFSVTVSLSTDVASNAVSATISVPPSLEIVSTSKSGSILSFWVSGPTIDPARGVVAFEGVVPNPGFQGRAGKVLTIGLRAKTVGAADVVLVDGAVLANDGAGSNVLSSLGRAGVTILGAPSPSASESDDAGDVSAAPFPGTVAIVSPSHPDQNHWYAQSSGTITWTMGPEATQVAVVIDQHPETVPTDLQSKMVSKAFEQLADGVWYAHVRSHGPAGWSSTAHYRLQIDTTPPESFVFTGPDSPVSWGGVALAMQGRDALSGIDFYSLSIDGGAAVRWQDDGTGMYRTPALAPGLHTIVAQAVDRAGNQQSARLEVRIANPEPLLSTTAINDYCQLRCPARETMGWLALALATLLLLVLIWMRRHDLGKTLEAIEASVAAVEKAVEPSPETTASTPAIGTTPEQFAKLLVQVEQDILTLETKKAHGGLSAGEAERLKNLLEVLHDIRPLARS